jgi:predicted CXXCH cytochrome family protein
MEILVRQVRQGTDGASGYLDTAVAADSISVGSAADSLIQLLGRSVAAKHALIQPAGAGFRIVCRRGCRVDVNGERRASAPLVIGDRIDLGGHRLTLIQPPTGFDIAIEVVQNTGVDASDFEAAFRTDLDRTWLSKRAASWVLIGLTLALGLAIPLATIWMHRVGQATPFALPDDRLWSSGPLSAAHAHAIGKDCGACHQDLFVRVRDAACADCHKSIANHISAPHRALTRLGDPERCAECHREHDDNASRQVLKSDQLCVGCHARSDSDFGSLRVQKVTGFAKAAHPAFTVLLQGRRAPLSGAHEDSHLKFSHAQHLDAAKVTRSGSDAPLGCGDCHIPSADGRNFQPVSMAQTCSACHDLSFDANAPTRQLPHGKPLDAMLMIEDYFSHRYADPPPSTAFKPVRRLPDLARDPSREAELETCSGSANVCARQRAMAEIENQFNERGCVSCHVVVDTHSADIHDRFEVTPVRLARNYFPDASFDHKSHRLQGKKGGDAACESCHAAQRSTNSRDLMLPDIDACLTCHRDRGDAGVAASGSGAGAAAAAARSATEAQIVTVQCISCHAYHPAETPPAGAAPAVAMTAHVEIAPK